MSPVAVGKEYIDGEEIAKLFVRCNGMRYQCRSASPDPLGICVGCQASGVGVGVLQSQLRW